MNVFLSGRRWLLFTLTFYSASIEAATFTVTNPNDSGPGSLYDAIVQANTVLGRDLINFKIPGDGVHLIDLRHSALPQITDPVVIDGYTQPGAGPNSRAVGNDAVILIQLDGGDRQSEIENGLVISAGGCVVRGLSITGIVERVPRGIPEDPPPFTGPIGAAIMLKGGMGNRIEGNFLGVNPDGTGQAGYSYFGVQVLSQGNTIGGTAAAARNVISRDDFGIQADAANNVIQGNYIGTNASGTAVARGDFGVGTGIDVTAADVQIGGTTAGSGNVIVTGSFSMKPHTVLESTAQRTIVQGNILGFSADGATRIDGSDSFRGIVVRGSQNLIGGLPSGAGNLADVLVETPFRGSPPVGVTVLSNIVLSHSTLEVETTSAMRIRAPIISRTSRSLPKSAVCMPDPTAQLVIGQFVAD